jgi:SAM-dependent methyltransferase
MTGPSAFEFCTDWNSPLAAHCERRVLACELNETGLTEPLTRFGGCLQGLAPDASCRDLFSPGRLVPAYDPAGVKTIARKHFEVNFAGQVTEPEAGRYYPRAIIAAALGCSKRELAPFLLSRVEEDQLGIDLNHPLARFGLTLGARRRELQQPLDSIPAQTAALVALLTGNGPGMQASANVAAAGWFANYPFECEDAQQDSLFYRTPRLVPHIDSTASAEVGAIYARLIKPGAQVLDLMSSWTSHLSDADGPVAVTGLGLNEQELAKNPRLDARVIHDLNESPVLPFEDQAFDLVICTASVEYLTRPIEVFRDVGRVLKPGGVFVNTFSNRWFPPKAIRLWARLHPFERLGLVLNYYRRAEVFVDLHTESLQGLPRPPGDKYSGRLPFSDPVFAVWGRREEK